MVSTVLTSALNPLKIHEKLTCLNIKLVVVVYISKELTPSGAHFNSITTIYYKLKEMVSIGISMFEKIYSPR